MAELTGAEESMVFPRDLQSRGIVPGAKVDIRDLDEIRQQHNVEVYLYFEEELARESTLYENLEEYGDVPDFERPFIRLDAFLQFAGESDPLFTQRLEDIPLIIEVIAYGEIVHEGSDEPVPYVKGLMPFLDELTMDDIPAAS